MEEETSGPGFGMGVALAALLLLAVILVFFLKRKKYECPICELTFDTEEELREHNKKKHSDIV